MHRGSGSTKLVRVNRGPIQLFTEKNSLIYPEGLRAREHETLFLSSQIRGNGARVYDLPHDYGGAQCVIIDDEDEDVIITISYRKCITVLYCGEPTDEELKTY